MQEDKKACENYYENKLFRYNCIPDIAPQKMTENEHCYKFLHPISRPIFSNSKKEYELTLNHANKNLTKRPVFSCVIEDIPILNSEFKPLGSIPLQCNKDEEHSERIVKDFKYRKCRTGSTTTPEQISYMRDEPVLHR
ncbi:hypothetical protein RhiirA1_403104 [Rhizophagus irregularis]|uniref:Uncharacterized protein n=1 Tax=Rhizophagus irregularis TaxID=588596 RepID=A0A2N0QVR3_9GLOM|nr:hypothetical protein RhiirA1_403104 [Rhizophagus irregularis]